MMTMMIEKKVEDAAGVITICGNLPHHNDQFNGWQLAKMKKEYS